jgi:chemotaxis protein MotB
MQGPVRAVDRFEIGILARPRPDMEDDAPAGVPEWVVTYGDMMSLLLTFFIMLVSLSDIQADKKYRAVIEALQKYVGYRTSPKAPPGKRFPLNSILERMRTLGSHYNKREGYGGVPVEAPAGKEVRVFHSAQGTSLRIGGPIPFAAGSITLNANAIRRLNNVSELLAGKPNKIEIVGHVSPSPLPANTPVTDKWLLSYLRARAVRDYLLAHGVQEIRMRIRAAADNEPLVETGDERSHHHDRVEIHILNRFAEDYIGPRVDNG